MSSIKITHIGGPTALIEVGGWRLLTDPTFDPPGNLYHFGWGTSSVKLTGPAVSPADLPPIDAVLLTHDHHGDNLDFAGRTLLTKVPIVVTTVSAARRLGGNTRGLTRGLRPWQVTKLDAPGRPTIEITATPCRHGPVLSRPITGEVIGFALRWAGQQHGVLWVTGDTVLYPGIRRIADRFAVSAMLLHLGGVRFPITGPLRYSMTAEQGVRLCHLMRARTAIPVHYEGWHHFQEARDVIEHAFANAPNDSLNALHWLPMGTATDITV